MTSDDAVRAVIDRVYAAWADQDADAFVDSYAADATATLAGSYLADREAIRTTMAAAFAGPLKGSRGVARVRDVRLLGTDAAVVTSTSAIVFAGEDEPAKPTEALDTWTLSRQDGSWFVAAYHSSPADAS